jgi:HTH-type transcriptional regulator, transcriptional repressor of NAD biosynthesis genes
MRTGLIIGKFMPLTKGHIALIDFGIQNCDNLIVAVCSLKSEPIDGSLRYNWVKKYYGNNKRVQVVHITEEIPGSSESSREISKLWSDYLKAMLPKVNIVFASEQYGEYVAEYMGIDYKLFDIKREAVPISATKVRENPFKYWDYIPDIVKHYYIKKVCIFGPDSCGKSTLTTDLAKHYETAFVPEIARNMFEWSDLQIDNLNINQLEQFARLQSEAVKSMIHFADKVLICDTDNITTQIYSEVYCGQITEEIKKYEDIDYNLYLLLDIDTPYMEEGQRNLPHRRKEMFERFKKELEKRNINYILINGSWEERFKKSVKAVDKVVFGR